MQRLREKCFISACDVTHWGGTHRPQSWGRTPPFSLAEKKSGDKQVCGEYLVVLKCQITTEGGDFHSLLTTHSWKLVLH